MAPKGSVIVTGGTVNLGYWAARQIAQEHPDYLVVVSSRTDRDHAADSINKALGQDNTVFMQLDLADSKNVRRYAKEWASKNMPPIQALLLNAGLQFPGATKKTVEGIESTFAINHVGHALLFHLLYPYLAQDARVVVTSSGTHDPAQNSGLPDAVYNTAEELVDPPPSDASGRRHYANSKLANVLWTYALHRRLVQRGPGRNITVNAFDPGLMPGSGLVREGTKTEQFLWNKVMPRALPVLRLLISPNIHKPQESGVNLARMATGADMDGVSGKYFEGRKEIPSSKDSYDEKKQDDLWRWTVTYLSGGDEAELTRFEELK
ncbi:dehydrogenase/reductase [Whalleya microplaca]|nr:dehydrogenase/reductase [Whalleya microplaca]